MTPDQPIPTNTDTASPPPRAFAISGIIFAALFFASLVLIRLAVPADPTDPGLRNSVRVALNLVPFTGIAFLLIEEIHPTQTLREMKVLS